MRCFFHINLTKVIWWSQESSFWLIFWKFINKIFCFKVFLTELRRFEMVVFLSYTSKQIHAHVSKLWNLFKVNNKNTRTTSALNNKMLTGILVQSKSVLRNFLKFNRLVFLRHMSVVICIWVFIRDHRFSTFAKILRKC